MGWLSGWNYRQTITIPSSGWSLSGNLSNQPGKVLIPSSNTAFWAGVKADGTDVRFTASDGSTLLDFEIEKFDSTADDAVYHVEIASLLSGSDTVIYVYYGNSGATSGESINGTWDSNYKAVYHLSLNKAAGAFADSTSNANNGTNNGTTDVAGKIDRGRNFLQSSAQYIAVADADSLSFGNGTTDTPLTIETWVKMTDATGFRIAYKADGTSGLTEYGLTTSGVDKLFLALFDNVVTVYLARTLDTALTADEGSWLHLVATYDGNGSGDGIIIYKNGATGASTNTSSGAYVAMENSTQPLEIGRYPNGGSPLYANGDMDEITISAVARSADWVKARYQSGAGGAWTFGAEEDYYNTVAIPNTTFNFTGKIPVVSINTLYTIPKADFNFTGKILTVSVVPPQVVNIPNATFNFIRFAPTLRTNDIGIQPPKVNFNFTGKVLTVDVTDSIALSIPKASFNFTGKVPAIVMTNSEEEISWGLFDSNGNAITAASPTVKIRQRETGYLLDWSDNTYKAAGGTTPSTTMTELNAADFPGYYSVAINVSNWSDGYYIAATTYSGSPSQNGNTEFLVKGGQVADSYNSAKLDVAVSTRLATVNYIAPDNDGIAAMSKWKNNKLARTSVVGNLETWVLYEDNNTTPALTWTNNTTTRTRTKAT